MIKWRERNEDEKEIKQTATKQLGLQGPPVISMYTITHKFQLLVSPLCLLVIIPIRFVLIIVTINLFAVEGDEIEFRDVDIVSPTCHLLVKNLNFKVILR